MSSSYGGGVIPALGDYTTAQTDTVIVADPGDGFAIGVISIFAMSAVAGVVTLEDGATVKFEGYPGANGGFDKTAPDGDFLFTISASTALTVTTDITGNHSVHVLYKERIV